jgi:hypothetical protein
VPVVAVSLFFITTEDGDVGVEEEEEESDDLRVRGTVHDIP